MGMFIMSVLVRKDNEEVLKRIEEEYEDAYAQDSKWIAFNTEEDVYEVAKELSDSLHVPTIGIMSEDSDIGLMGFYDKDKETKIIFEAVEGLAEEYEFGENENIEYLKDYLVEPHRIEEVHEVLEEEDIFVEDKIFAVLKMLGVEEELLEELG